MVRKVGKDGSGVLSECVGVFERQDKKKQSTSMWVMDVETELKDGYEDAGLRQRKWVSLARAIEIFDAEGKEVTGIVCMC